MNDVSKVTNEEINHYFYKLTDEQLDIVSRSVLEDAYDRERCKELGIDYANIRIIDMMKLYVDRGFKAGFLR